MEAKEKSMKEVFGGAPQKLIVPFFQRRYVWKEENWKELLKSIEDNDDIHVFLGSIIIKWSDKKEPTVATIVDGQQRLTTISLLTKAIYDEFSDKDKINIKSLVHSMLFYKKNAADDEKMSEIKIEHSRVDIEEYKYIISSGLLDDNHIDLEDLISKYQGQIARCYVYYRKKLQAKGRDGVNKILNTLYDDNNKMLVRVELREEDVNEQSIFDTINRAGTRLSTADIIKNNIFKQFLESCSGDVDKEAEVYQIYDKKWDKLFYSENGTNEWDNERYFGNVSRNNLEFLLYCVACIKWAEVDTNDFSGRLETVYTKNTNSFCFVEFKELITDIYEYALLFKEHINKFRDIMINIERKEKEYFSFDEDLRRLLMILEVFGVQMFYPYVLKILKDANGDLKNAELVKNSKILESFIVRRRICGSSVSDYSTKCNLILNTRVEKLYEKSGDNEISISDVDIKGKLKNVKSDTARLLLFWIELSRKNKNSDVDGLTYTYTLEHIMPQKWEENWNVTDELIENRREHINDIGNLTLLKNSLNIIVKNSDFTTKIKGIPKQGRKKKKEGYDGNASLDITSEIIKQHNDGDKNWDEVHIDNRRNGLAEEIIKIWPTYKIV